MCWLYATESHLHKGCNTWLLNLYEGLLFFVSTSQVWSWNSIRWVQMSCEESKFTTCHFWGISLTNQKNWWNIQYNHCSLHISCTSSLPPPTSLLPCICHSGWSLLSNCVQAIECNFVDCWLVIKLFCCFIKSIFIWPTYLSVLSISLTLDHGSFSPTLQEQDFHTISSCS